MTAAGATSLAAPAASADAGDITIVKVSSPTPPQGSAGAVTVETQSVTAINGNTMTVNLYASGAGTPAISVTGFHKIGGTGSDNDTIWQVNKAAQIQAGQLPAGTYTATVDATEVHGTRETDLPGGSFPFLIQPVVTLSVTPATIDYGHQTATFTGQASEYPPGATTTQAYAGQPLVVIGPASPANPTGEYPVTTSASGSYRFTAAPPTGSYFTEVQGTPTTVQATSAQVAVTDMADPVALTARFAHTSIDFAQPDKVTGTATYKSGGAARPLARVKVTIARTSPSGQGPVTVTTNAAGQFSASIPAQRRTGNWTVSTSSTPLLTAARRSMTLTVRQQTGFRHVAITLGALRRLDVHACLIVTSQGSPGRSVNAAATLQYEAGRKGPWRKLVTIRPTGGTTYCASGSSDWQVTVPAPLPSAYYRLSFSGSAQLESTTSKAVNRFRDSTKITSFSVTPRRVTTRGAITVSGRLWRHTRKWHPYGGRKVAIEFRYQGSWYRFQFEPKTNSQGFFTGRFTVYVSSTWIAKYVGDHTHFGSDTAGIKVTVTSGHSHPDLPRASTPHHGLRRLT